MSLSLNDVAGANGLEHFNATGAIRRGLPALAYVSEDFWQLENEKLFPNSWVFVGFAHELAKPGDVIPVTVGGKPIFLIRNNRDEIGCYHNVCRHRCLKIIDKTANVGPRIRCPYHSWVYNLDGELQSTPFFGGPESHMPEDFDAKEQGLVPVRTGVWHDWIFVNLSGTAADFGDFIAPMERHLQGINFDLLDPVATLDFGEVNTNWKALMENFIEPYHVQFVHSSTTEQPLADHFTVVDGTCLGSAVDVAQESDAADTLAVSSRYLTLFPNFVLGRYFPDQIGVHLNVSTGIDRTWQRRVIYTTEGETLESGQVEALSDLWYKVHKEDHEICERLQVGRGSDVAALGGWLSPHWEDSVRRFQELVVEAVE